MGEILQDGFVTSGDPLLVVRNHELEYRMRNMDAPWAAGPGQLDSLLPFALGYMKGKARMFTLLTILSLVVDDQVDLEKAGQGAGVWQGARCDTPRGAQATLQTKFNIAASGGELAATS